MNTRRLRDLVSCAMLGALTAMGLAAGTEAPDGLVPAKLKNYDEAWQKPDASFKGYTSVLIRPATVAFSKNWRARDFGAYGLRSSDVEQIRANYAGFASDTFARVLAKGGYPAASAPAANVLEIQLEIVDLYINGPDVGEDVLTRTYVRNFGDIRLIVTLRDSVSGTVLFRGTDFKRGDENGRLEWANSVYNRAEAERALAGWARQLQRLLQS